MDYKQILLLTSFCVMACDGEIAKEEVSLLREFANDQKLFGSINIDEQLNKYINALKEQGYLFIKSYLSALSEYDFSEDEEISLLRVAVKTIYADNTIEYSEIRFFKAIRRCLNISDNKILSNIEGIEDYWLEEDAKSREDNNFILDFDPSSLHIG